MKKFFSKTGILTIILTFILSTNVFAANSNTTSQDSRAKNIAENFVKKIDKNKKIIDEIPLYGINNNKKAILFSLKNSGYIIIDLRNNSIPEFSINQNNRYFNKKNKKYLYNGPLNYYEKKDNKIINLKTNSEIKNTSNLKDISINKNNKMLSRSVQANKTTDVSNLHEKSLKYSLSNYSYNPNGVCGSCAAAIFLRYWSDHINSKYVPSNLKTSDGVKLIKYLIPYNEGKAYVNPNVKSHGTSPASLRAGIQNYLKSRGVTDTMHVEPINFSRFSERISNNRPLIVGLFKADGNPYGDHWVAGHSYLTVEYVNGLIEKLAYVGVTDGWGHSNVYISKDYCDYIIW